MSERHGILDTIFDTLAPVHSDGHKFVAIGAGLTLLFFLLIGRVADHRARGRVRATVELLLTLRSTDVTVLA